MDGRGLFGTGDQPMSILHLDHDLMIVKRTDTTGPATGLVAVYSGQIAGKRINGSVAYYPGGRVAGARTGTWFGVIDDPGAPQTAALKQHVAGLAAAANNVPGPPPSTAGATANPPARPVAASSTTATGVGPDRGSGRRVLQHDGQPLHGPDHLSDPNRGLSNEISAVRLIIASAKKPEDAKTDGEPFLHGAYDSNGFTGQIRTDKGTWAPVTFAVLSPDHLKIGNTDYHRFVESMRHDVACDPENKQHVEHSAATQRGLDALKDKQMELAACWFRIGAMGGNRKAQSNLGISLLQGRGTQQNFEEAFQWFKKSAVQGDFEGELNLAQMYHAGKGTPKDEENAQYWLHVAARNKDAPEAMQNAEGFRNMVNILSSLIFQNFMQSPLCSVMPNEDAISRRQREQIIADDGIDCSIRIPLETGPPHR